MNLAQVVKVKYFLVGLFADLVTWTEDKYYVLFLLTVCHHKGSKKIKECLSEVKKDCKSDPEVSITQQIIVRC